MNNLKEKQLQILDFASKIELPIENISDMFHDFSELYKIRLAYNVALFNEWGKDVGIPIIVGSNPNVTPINTKYQVHKSWKHYDGKECFDGGWFIVVAQLPTGQISNHYEAIHWNKFRIPETEKALYPFDGHSTNHVIERLINL